jgi:hypothetical protein
MTYAHSLISQGRNQTLEQWLNGLPDFGANAWLYYWKGVCRLAVDLIAARGFFEKAFSYSSHQMTPPGFTCHGRENKRTYSMAHANPRYWIDG